MAVEHQQSIDSDMFFLIETLKNTMYVVPIVSNFVLYFPKCHTVMAVYQFLIVI